jgi:hypothetical protein
MSTTALVAATLAIASSVEAQFVEVSLGTNVNEDIHSYTGGTNYQLGGTQLYVNGVPFALAELTNNPNTTGIVQAGGAGRNSNTGPFEFTFSVPVGTAVTILYTLLNTVYGESGVAEAP